MKKLIALMIIGSLLLIGGCTNQEFVELKQEFVELKKELNELTEERNAWDKEWNAWRDRLGEELEAWCKEMMSSW